MNRCSRTLHVATLSKFPGALVRDGLNLGEGVDIRNLPDRLVRDGFMSAEAPVRRGLLVEFAHNYLGSHFCTQQVPMSAVQMHGPGRSRPQPVPPHPHSLWVHLAVQRGNRVPVGSCRAMPDAAGRLVPNKRA